MVGLELHAITELVNVTALIMECATMAHVFVTKDIQEKNASSHNALICVILMDFANKTENAVALRDLRVIAVAN